MKQDEMEILQRGGLAKTSIICLFAIILLFGGLGYWAASTEISGAVIATGVVSIEGQAKKVQHRDGGTIAKILVEDRDEVVEQQLIARLDTTELRANLELSKNELRQLLVNQARHRADVEETAELRLTSVGEQDDIYFEDEVVRVAKLSFEASQRARVNRVAQLTEQIYQIEQQIEGFEQERSALNQQIDFLQQELNGVRALYEENLVVFTRVTALERELAARKGELGGLLARIAQARAAISEKKLKITQLTDDFRAETLNQLSETQRQIFDARQRYIAAKQQLLRSEIRAPVAGIVHENVLNTEGGVIGPGEVLMLIVPQDTGLFVEAKVLPSDVEKVFSGQKVTLRMSAFDQKTTPELVGTVEHVAPDKSQDQTTGHEFYRVRVSIADEELDRMPNQNKLIPGMPVETLIKTEDRTVLSYLLKPITDQFALALRES